MKRALLLASILPVALIMTGCESTGLSAHEQNNGYSALISGYYQKTPDKISTKPVSTPIKLAVAQIGETAPETAFTTALAKDAHLVRNVVAVPMPGEKPNPYQSKDKELTSDIFAAQVQSCRNLARELGADYLLLIGGSIDSYHSHNIFSPLDLTVVGAAVLPGTKVHSNGKAAGALIDVVSGKIVLLSNAELKRAGLTPSFYAEDKRDSMNVKLREEVLEKLAADFLEKLQQRQSTQVSAIDQ